MIDIFLLNFIQCIRNYEIRCRIQRSCIFIEAEKVKKLEHILIFKIYCATLIFLNENDIETPTQLPPHTTVFET